MKYAKLIRYRPRIITRYSVPLIAGVGFLYEAKKSRSESCFQVTRLDTVSSKPSQKNGHSSDGDVSSTGFKPENGDGQPHMNMSTDEPASSNYFSSNILGSIETAIEEAVRNVSSLQLHQTDHKHQSEGVETETSYQSIGQMLAKLLLPNDSDDSLNDVLEQVRDISGRGEIQDVSTVFQVLELAKQCRETLDSKISAHFGEEGLPQVQLQQLLYYIEKEDEIKNPSWKRRKHYFFPGIDIDLMDDLNEKLKLTDLAYSDTIDEIQSRLDAEWNSELIYCSLESLPNKPAHFIAVKRNQPYWNSELEVILVVCGTKQITDVITDLLCDAEPYRNGFAHSGIRDCGQWIAEKHGDLLEKLRILSKKKKIKLTLLGHSLGAGAATIAGIELNDNSMIDVEVVGFGCPALLSPELSEHYESIVTTVIGDNDCVPRMSMATMTNALIDITHFDYSPYALRDLEEAVNELHRFLPSLVDNGVKEKILDNLNILLPEHPSSDEEIHTRRMEIKLYPPGRCIHFYNDGFGTSGSVVPCKFFDELDINRRLLHDHFIHQGYQKIFLDLMRQYKNDNHYKFNT